MKKKLNEKSIFNVASVLVATILLLLINSCSSPKKTYQLDNSSLSPYQIYSIVNNLDTNSQYYLKNHYLFDLLINASKNEQLGHYQSAVVDLLEALKYDSSKAILYGIAKNLYYLDKFQLSFDYSFKAYLLDSAFIPNINLIVSTLMQLYRTEEAIYFSSKLLSLKQERANENDIERHLYLLEKYDTTFTKALQFCETLPSRQRTKTILLNMIRYYDSKKDTINQILTLEDYLQTINGKQKDLYSLLKLFDFLLTQERYEQFFDDFNNFASSIDCSEIFDIISNLTKYLANAEKNYSQFSEKLINRINELCTSNVTTNLLFAKIYYSIGDSAKALPYETAVMVETELDIQTLLRVANFLFWNNKRNETFLLMSKFEKKFALNPSFQITKGNYYLICDSLGKAKESLEFALELDSTSSFIYSSLGWLYSELGENSTSDSFYTKALEIDPLNPTILNNFAYSLIERAVKLDYAKQLIELALGFYPKEPNFLDTYGWLFYRLGNYDLAIKYISESIQIDGTRAEPYMHLGEIYQVIGNIELARKCYEKASSIEPNDLEIIYKLQELTK